MTPLPRTLWECLVDFWQTNLPLGSLRRARRKHKPPPKKRSYQPEFEILERREVPSVAKFSSSTYTIGEAGTSATITVEIDTNPSQSSTVDYSTANGTATAGSDYTSASGTLTFTQFGPLSQTFTVSITNDLVIENNETVNLTLSNPTADLTLGSPSTATLTINDNDLTGVTEYTVPTSNAKPLNITSGPDGNLWFTENNTNKIGKVTTSGTFTEYSITFQHKPYDIVEGPDGKLWFTTKWTDGGIPETYYGVGNITTSGTVTEYDLPAQGEARGIASALGADGNLWFTEYAINKIAKVTTSGSLTEYTIPTANSGPEDITLGPDGNLWFTEYDGNKIGKVTTSGTFTEYSIPTSNSQPFGITLGPDGNLWFTEFNGNKIGRITTDGTITEFSIPTAASQPQGITKGPDGNIWFVEFAADQVGRITPEGTITEYSIIIGGSGLKPTSIVTGPDNNLWITERDGNKIAKFAWAVAGQQRTIGAAVDRGQFALVPFGPALVSPQTGNLRLQHSFDVARGGVSVGGPLALTYNSETVDVKPIVEVTFPTNSADGLPTQLDGRLNWNSGGYGSWVTFSTTGHSAGDTYLLSFQVSSAVTSTGYYPWTVQVKATFSGNNTLTRDISGKAAVVVNGSGSSFGHGWSIAGLDKLTSVTGGVLWVYGSGGARFFESAGSGFISPPDDFGTLTQNTTYTYTAKDQVKWYFDSSGYLTKVVDPRDFTRTFTYSSNRISTITEPDGAIGTFSYDGSNKLSKIEAPGSRTVTVTVNGSGDLTNLTNPDGSLRTFTYDSAHRLTNDKWGSLNGTFAYDSSNGTLSTVTLDASTYLSVAPVIEQGLNTSPAKNAADAVGVLKDALNQRTTYTFDAAARPTKVIAGDGGTSTWQRDFAGQSSAVVDPLNRRTTFNYSYGSGEGDLSKITYPDGTTQEFQYDATFHKLTQIKDQLGKYTTFTYDATTGNLLTAKDQLAKVTTYSYSSGLLESTTDPRGNRTTFQYDSSRRLEVKINALGGRETYTYDSAGNLRTVTNPRGNVTTFSYDGMRRLTSTQAPTGALETWTYNAQGQELTHTNALGKVTSYSYDAASRIVSVQDALGNRTTNVYDAAGQLSATIDPLSNRTTFSYDGAGRQVTIKDALGNVTTNVYDSADNLINVVDSLNNKTTFVYDALNRTIEEIDALGKTATFAYNAAGYMSSTTDRVGRRRDFTYDDAGRNTGETWVNSGGGTANVLTFTYDAVGNRLTAADYDGTYTLTYDALNRVETVKDLWGITLTFTYDANSNRTKVEDSKSGTQTSVYDAANRLTTRDQGVSGQEAKWVNLTYKANGQVESAWRYTGPGPGTTLARTTFTYDDAGRNTNLHHTNGSGSNIANYTYTYDNGSRLTTEVTNGTTKTYTYDNTHQLTGDGTNSWTFDANGNRTNTGYQTGTGNRLTNDGTWAYTYDDAGNRTKKSKGALLETWTYGYDQKNQLLWTEKRLTDGGLLQLKVEFKYDAWGNRVEKKVDNNGDSTWDTTERYAYDGWKNGPQKTFIGNENWDVWADLDGSNNLQTRYVHGDVVDQIFARIDSGGTTYWLLTDRLASVRDVIDNSGVVKDTIAYDGYGKITTETDASFRGRYAWTGREIESQTGVQYNRARYYDPNIGRWISQDPLGFQAGDSNLYRYVRNRATLEMDPSGLQVLVAQAPPVKQPPIPGANQPGTPFDGPGPGPAIMEQERRRMLERQTQRFPDFRKHKVQPAPPPQPPFSWWMLPLKFAETTIRMLPPYR